jgi:hypothetical protein
LKLLEEVTNQATSEAESLMKDPIILQPLARSKAKQLNMISKQANAQVEREYKELFVSIDSIKSRLDAENGKYVTAIGKCKTTIHQTTETRDDEIKQALKEIQRHISTLQRSFQASVEKVIAEK